MEITILLGVFFLLLETHHYARGEINKPPFWPGTVEKKRADDDDNDTVPGATTRSGLLASERPPPVTGHQQANSKPKMGELDENWHTMDGWGSVRLQQPFLQFNLIPLLLLSETRE